VAATQPAREAFDKRFDTEVDPTGSLNPQERARRASSARKAYFTRLALKSAQCRRQAAEMGAAADAADRELSPDGDELR
jgi:hypothetical protein